jgi:L-asparaginase / beta-aspartyl-peptidase
MTPVVVVHGGCGAVPRDAAGRQAACDHAADTAWALLDGGGRALDAVEAAIRSLEDAPVLNAGTGSDLQADGVARMDASVMTADGRAGAVAQVPGVKNPIRLARYLLDHGAHVMLSGPEAMRLAFGAGLDPAGPATEASIAAWRDRLDAAGKQLDYAGMAEAWRRQHERLGTVGCVALDDGGRLAAGTSTGGMARCYPGRIGDSAVIGAGTYCTRAAGVSMTGLGERMLVLLSAKRFCDLVADGRPIDRAATAVLDEVAALTPGVAGLIALGVNGGIVAAHHTPFMVTATRPTSSTCR